MNILTDQELRALVANAMRGDREAITSLLKYYTPALYFVSRLYLGDKETAKKSEQQALRSALKKLKDSLSAADITDWMIDQVRGEALNTLKPVRTSGAYSMYYDSYDEYPNLEDAMAYTEEECRIRILKALDQVAEPERAVLALRFFDHMPIDDIARRMEVTPEEVRSLLVSGKAGLRNSGTPTGTLAALCERVNPYEPETETAGTIQPEEPEEFAEPEPKEVHTVTETVRETEYRSEEPQTQTVVEQPATEPEPETLLTEPEDEIPEVAAEVPAAAVAEAVQPAVQEPQAEYEAEEKAMPVRKKKKSHWLLKSLIAILLGAAAAVGLYLYLVMNKAKPAVTPQTKPAETQETETVPEETEKPAETEQKPAETEEKPEEKPEETPSETEATGDVVGSAEVIVDELRIRSGSGTGFDEVDVAPYGAVYDVYEVRSDNEYMWYRIGEDMWIADSEGSWVTFTPTE